VITSASAATPPETRTVSGGVPSPGIRQALAVIWNVRVSLDSFTSAVFAM
jgi:hypothetical protein